VRHWTAQGMSLGPALASNYRKQANAIGLYNTRSGKGSGHLRDARAMMMMIG
jgi:hypothetical protein